MTWTKERIDQSVAIARRGLELIGWMGEQVWPRTNEASRAVENQLHCGQLAVMDSAQVGELRTIASTVRECSGFFTQVSLGPVQADEGRFASSHFEAVGACVAAIMELAERRQLKELRHLLADLHAELSRLGKGLEIELAKALALASRLEAPVGDGHLLPIAEAARRACLSTETVRGWVNRTTNPLSVQSIGGTAHIRLADVIAERDAKSVANPKRRLAQRLPTHAPKLEERDAPRARKP